MFKRSEQYSLETQRWMTFLSSTALVVFCKFTITSGCGGAKSKVRLIKPGKIRVQRLCQFSLFGNVFKVRRVEECNLCCKQIIFIKYQFHYLKPTYQVSQIKSSD